MIAIGRLGLKIAIVQGQTPLLLSNTLLRTLKAQIDVSRQLPQSPLLIQPVPLKLNPRGLLLIDINLLSQFASPKCSIAETFVHVDTNQQFSEKTAAAAPEASAQKIILGEEPCANVTNTQSTQPAITNSSTDSFQVISNQVNPEHDINREVTGSYH